MTPDKRAMQRFGREMARRRRMADRTQGTLARELGVSASHLSNIERGYRPPVPALLTRIDRALEAGGRLSALWEELTGSGRQAWLTEVTTLVREAASVMEYQVNVVPGLLQTEDYARELITAGAPWASREDVLARVAERIGRARAFADAASPLFWVVLDGMIIRRSFTTPETRRNQLEHLVSLVEAERVSIQIIEVDYPGHPGLTGPFKVITPDLGPDVVYAESIHEGQIVTAAADVAQYRLLFGRLQAVALGPAESLRRMRKTLEEDLT